MISKKIQQFGFYYGIRIIEIADILDNGYHVLLETTLWGVDQLKKHFSNVVSIFISPPSITELEKCLRARKRESEEDIALRVDLARTILSNFKGSMVDYSLINEKLEMTIESIDMIVTREKLKSGRKKP